jgi:hypothetical protein
MIKNELIFSGVAVTSLLISVEPDADDFLVFRGC